MSGPQIWDIEKDKEREKEKVGSRPAKLIEKKGNRDLECSRDKKQGRHFLVEKT